MRALTTVQEAGGDISFSDDDPDSEGKGRVDAGRATLGSEQVLPNARSAWHWAVGVQTHGVVGVAHMKTMYSIRPIRGLPGCTVADASRGSKREAWGLHMAHLFWFLNLRFNLPCPPF